MCSPWLRPRLNAHVPQQPIYISITRPACTSASPSTTLAMHLHAGAFQAGCTCVAGPQLWPCTCTLTLHAVFLGVSQSMLQTGWSAVQPKSIPEGFGVHLCGRALVQGLGLGLGSGSGFGLIIALNSKQALAWPASI